MLKPNIYFKMIKRLVVYVPAYKPPDFQDIYKLKEFVLQNKSILVLSGAGISTESGSYLLKPT